MAEQRKVEEEIGGFYFSDPAQIEQARKEEEGVNYLRERLDRSNAEYLLKVYNHAADNRLFETPVGLSFLKELRDYLNSLNRFAPEEIHGIFVPPPKVIRKREKPAETGPSDAQVPKKRSPVLIFFVVVLSAALIGMFVIAFLSRDNVNILNYENAIIDKYEDWEKDLEERERAIREKEQIYGTTEDSDRG